MEICAMSVQFPASDLGHIPTCFDRGSSPTTSFFVSCSRPGKSRQETENPKSEFSNRMFIMGMGFVGKFFACDLTNQGWAVSGSCTSLVNKKKLKDMGFDVSLFNAKEPELCKAMLDILSLFLYFAFRPEVLDILNKHTHLVVSIPPIVGIGDPMLQQEELLKSRLMDGNLKWLSYLSSTSVYGNCGGMWVDEDYPVSPTDEKAKSRLAAEEGWLKLGHDLGISTQIFRLGGIYGPGRSAVDTIIKQKPLSEIQRMRASRHYTSRVHVADICQALRASIYKPSPGKIYNIVDDDPAPRTEVFSFAWDLVNQKWPGHLKQTNSLYGTESFSVEESSRGEKQVSNARIKKELGVRLHHPNYKSGLKSIIDPMDNPFLQSHTRS
ncbi:NAD(P)-binding Rossmann-fold superfamily protein [Actinidia rufa]|uniref:NAD(P)-binding Rossmann-fold superfamily protein n=1 Tax=Actinidia rufa TaxID=165716 RepID=A0A7J0GHS3_9ERIC|nr:NAD(P)-binding Rossmann-fold superfamily protein [Actinidia rufa]